MTPDVHTISEELVEQLQQLRRQLHATPEIGLHLPRTQQSVLDALAGVDAEISCGEELSSVTVVIRGAHPQKRQQAVLLRGDMDALPVVEDTGFVFASDNGAMHACGHDVHTAGLVGAVRLLCARRAELAGDVICMFQPGEEGFGGAGLMVSEGVLEAAGVPVIAAYGVHVSADRQLGHIWSKPGSYMAAFSHMDITVRGVGGHGSRPHTAYDPIQVATMLPGQLQEYISRRFDVFSPVVLTVGSIHGGQAANIIPETCSLSVGIRTFSEEVTARCAEELPHLVRSVVRAHGLEVDVNYKSRIPATVNAAAEAEFYMDTARKLFGDDAVHLAEAPLTASEDFSEILVRVPGAYGHFGAMMPDDKHAETNHSPKARHSDAGLGDHARFLATLALWRLRDESQHGSDGRHEHEEQHGCDGQRKGNS